MRTFGRQVITLWIMVSLALAAAVLFPGLLGLQRYVIVGDSMTGTIPKGAIVYAKVVPVDELKVGDIITFVPPGFTAPVTHRIKDISIGTDGSQVFQTKGDYNKVADPWKLKFIEPSVARYVFNIPYLGYALAAFSIREVRILLIALPALLISLSLLWSMWRSAAEAVRRHEAAVREIPVACYVAEEEAGA